jgi:dihydroxy-acid dehydratase
MMMGHKFDGMVLIGNCDKIVPGMLMAAARLNVPAVYVSGGPMLEGRYKGEGTDLIKGAFEAVGACASGKISEESLEEMSLTSCPTCGSCAGMYTANTMNCLAEVLGLALPGNGTIPAPYGARRALGKKAGITIMELLKKDIKPRDIMTLQAFKNAIAVDMAIGGSTNTVLHLMAIANQAQVKLDLEEFDRISSVTPQLAKLSPASENRIGDLHEAGGIPAIIKRLYEAGLIDGTARNVSGLTIAEIAEQAHVANEEIIKPIDKAYSKTGGIVVLKGNLAPDGAVIKQGAVAQEMFTHEGPARVFNSEEEAFEAIMGGKINKGDVVVVRYEGPKGGPGMREMLSPTSAITGMGLSAHCALITDGRFSGGSNGASIGHVSPEAAEGGPIALLEEGDIIQLDIHKRTLNVKLSDEELTVRKDKWVKPAIQAMPNSYLRRYAALVTSASTGAVMRDDV